MPDEQTPMPPSRWPALINLPPSPSLSSFGAACVIYYCASSTLRPSVCYPSIILVVNIICTRTFCDHLKAPFFWTRLVSFWSQAGFYGPNAAPLSKGQPTLPPPCLASSFLPFLLRPICLASCFLPCLISSTLPRFHPPSLPPHCPSSISPFHPGGLSRVKKQAARTSFSFDLSI